ncbi:MAG: aldo/keto reductase [Bdellovibrionales bacterium]|nr:aldo/keto reductase [Bdellovibrionales bacterium]
MCSVIGLGTWAIGGEWKMGWGPQDEQDSFDAISESLDLGINWIDTAPAYGFGRAEEVIGKFLRMRTERPLLATKCGILNDGSGNPTYSLRQKSIEREVEASLRRLGLDCIDLYQIHWPKPDEEVEEGVYTLQRLKERGLIRWAGVSNFSVQQLERAKTIGEVASLQPPYSLLNRGIEQDTFSWCRNEQLGVITYSPMECGLLAGKFSRAWVESLPPTDWRKARWGAVRTPNYFAEPELSALEQFTDSLKEIAARRERPMSQLVINWVLRRPEVTATIVGARKKGQIAETAKATEWSLTAEELDEIERTYQSYQKSMGRDGAS